jgi:hypothetical protein
MVVNYNDIINAIARAEDVALYNARSRAIELSNGCKPSKEDDDKAIEIESWIQLLTRAAETIDETTCLDDDIIWEIIQNVNELNREVDCDVSRTYSRHSSSGGGSNPPSGYVERVLGLYVDNTDPSNPIIRIYVNPLTISGDGTEFDPFSAIGGGGGAVSSVNGLTGAVVLTTTNIAEGVNLYYTNARGIASILTGLSVSGSAVIATDTILQAVGKLQNQINGLAGGVEYQGTWNASTNTPTLTSSVGTQGHYYVVSVAGSTNLNGITDWALGDWAIFNGTVWQKVDNTDAVISVNGQTGIVTLTTSDIGEGTNQYFTTTRVLATVITGFVSGAGTVAATDTILQAINKIVGNLASKQDIPVEVTGNLTAVLNTNYINTANATYTDPTPAQGKGFQVYVRNGTATIGGVGYSVAGSVIWRVYHSGAWASYLINEVTLTNTATLTNKRITARTGTTTSSATPAINTDNVDFYSLTAQTVDITSFTTNLSGTPTEGQTLWIAITGTAARAITWGASFEASTIALPITTVTTNRLDVAFIWNTVTSKWRCVGTC